MNLLENYYKQVIKYDLINKFFYNQLKDIPELKKIILNFGCKSFEIKNIAASLLSLELITTKQGTITKSKRANILLKIRKGYPVGCTVVLTKNKMYQFFFKLLTEVFPNLKDFKGINISKNLKNKSFSLTLLDLIDFKELEKQFYLFNNLPPLNIILITNTKTRKELIYLLNSFKMPFVKNF
ncbi:50S ribosomal protein L5 (mitochondrion) [Nitzschia inconspicua]|uniref:50S ribosomal protein L5 n=1 Tax=Nitzschia inconspicua TaxID=303405 RepID=A0A8H2SIJ3_9STRA|nr:50S ribosomal protein L5 [Nitzschia inconspicua]